MKGIVTFFSSTKGHGFIKGEDQVDYFVRNSNTFDKIMLISGQHVSFSPMENEQGKYAEKIRIEEA